MHNRGRTSTWLRTGFALLAGAYVLPYAFMPRRYGLLDHVALAIHEAGHLVFAPFGEFMGIAGGTLLQLIVPLAFVLHFRYRNDAYAASVLLLWLAQSLFNVGTYAADARAQLLPLVGGEGVIHDWAYMLGRLGWLEHYAAIAATLRTVALLAVGLGVWSALRAAPVSRTAPDRDTVPGPEPTDADSGPREKRNQTVAY